MRSHKFSIMFTLVYERNDGGEREQRSGGGVLGVFISGAALEAHSSPPTQLPSGVKQQTHTQ